MERGREGGGRPCVEAELRRARLTSRHLTGTPLKSPQPRTSIRGAVVLQDRRNRPGRRMCCLGGGGD